MNARIRLLSLTLMPTPAKSISGTVITYNEEDHIEACIKSLSRLCDDIVVVDSLSTDRTVEIAKTHGAKVIEQEYLGEGKQRHVTEQHAEHDWILALDADERIDDEMCATIELLSLDDPQIGYAFNRKSYCGQHWINGPGFYPDYITRLYNRKYSSYEAKFGHAGVRSPRVEQVSGHILHYTYDDLTDWIAKINQVTSLDARGMYEAGRPRSNWKPALSAIASFFRHMIFQGGLFRGVDARTITVTSIFRSYMKYHKLNEIHEQAAADDR